MRRTTLVTLLGVALLAPMLVIVLVSGERVDDSGRTEVEAPRTSLRIPMRGRLVLPHASISGSGTIPLVLELDEDSLGDGQRRVRVVSGDGRRLDVESIPLEGDRDAVRIDVDAQFLQPGIYLIELRAADAQPLNLRRFVLELH